MEKLVRLMLLPVLFVPGILIPLAVHGQDPCGGGDDRGGFGCAVLSFFGAKEDGDEFNIPRVHAVDPNEITGELGFDSAQWVSAFARLGYTVYFENDPDFATAPAQVVTIRLPVHENLNMFTVHLGSFGFGIFNFDVPPATTFYQQRLDVRDSLNCFVDITAGIDVVKNELFWIFESIDPLTGLPPQDAQTGFLPVNDTTVNIYNDSTIQKGEGYVNFTIVPKPTVQTGDTISAKASIIFDINAPIETNTWTNLLDAVPPASIIDSAVEVGSTFHLYLSGADDPGGTGLAFYDLYVSKDSGAYMLIREKIDTNIIVVDGTPGAHYAYYTRATDNVGNEELPKYLPDVEIVFPSLGWDGGPIVYVNHAATSGLNNGTSWPNAFTDLQDALYVMSQFPEIEEVWVAQGIYYPTMDADRTRSFVFQNAAHVYGGFAGTETARSERNPTNYPVILSGDIAEAGSFPDNSYHVVTFDNTCTDCLLDGAEINFGYATGPGEMDGVGAGVLSLGTGSLNDVKIQFCFALNTAAALLNSGAAAHLTMSGCLVAFNISILDDRDVLNRDGGEMEMGGVNVVRE